LTVNPSAVTTGESVNISVYVLNIGDVQDSYTAKLKINGFVEETKEIILASGASATVSFTVTKDIAGRYEVEIGGQTGEFTVSAPVGAINWSSFGKIFAAVVTCGVAAVLLLTQIIGVLQIRSSVARYRRRSLHDSSIGNTNE